MRAYDAGKDVDLAAAASEVARLAEEEAPRTSCCSEVNRQRVARHGWHPPKKYVYHAHLD